MSEAVAAEREARQAAEDEVGRERAEQSALDTELQKTEKLIVTVSQTLPASFQLQRDRITF